jgi:hypothetical protein
MLHTSVNVKIVIEVYRTDAAAERTLSLLMPGVEG